MNNAEASTTDYLSILMGMWNDSRNTTATAAVDAVDAVVAAPAAKVEHFEFITRVTIGNRHYTRNRFDNKRWESHVASTGEFEGWVTCPEFAAELNALAGL
jgi:hypothetical protein